MKIFNFKKGENWAKGEVTIKYNLQTFLKILGLLILIPFVLIYRICKWVCQGVCWSAKKIWPAFCRLGTVLLLVWLWIKSLFHCSEAPRKVSENKSNSWVWILLLLFILGSLFIWRSCGSSDDKLAIPVTQEEVYAKSFDKVIVARAYLDGVQQKVLVSCPRALVGLKFIKGQSVEGYNFNGMTYDEAVKVVAEDWKPLVLDNLHVPLSEQKMAVITLAAMRMGKNGFLRSTFLKKVNEGKLTEATEYLRLEKKNGEIRETGEEPKQYFYMLRILWNGEMDIDHLLDMPMFSYRVLPVNKIYDEAGKHVWSSSIEDKLYKGANISPREALSL